MISMRTALVSVIIPTHNRPQYLPRAVNSALNCQGPDVEIIVVPNGPDESWKQSLAQWTSDSRVRVSPIETAHANVARNHGMDLATGRYLRFLDDDDYLFAAANGQRALLDCSNCDVSLGGINLVNSTGSTFGQYSSAATADYVIAMLHPTRLTHNCALLWRRDSIANRRWDETCQLGQDTAWTLSIARDMDLSLLSFPDQTGAWVHHPGQRISKRAKALGHNKATAEILLDTIYGLERRGALTEERCAAAAAGLWQCIHNAFPLAPWYWSRLVKYVLHLAPESRPDDKAYTTFPLKQVGPGLAEWLMAPHRLIKFHRRERARAKGLLPPW